jgi:hypothetical protein
MNAKATLVIGVSLPGLLFSTAHAGPSTTSQSPALLLDEAQTVYLGNLASVCFSSPFSLQCTGNFVKRVKTCV